MARKATPVRERIMSVTEIPPGNVESDACWTWTGRFENGQPVIKVEGQRKAVRPIVYRYAYGDPPPSRFVTHPRIKLRCGNPACVRPDHMQLKTDADRELREIVAELHRTARQRLARDPSNPKLQRMAMPWFIKWRASKILADRQRHREAATSEPVRDILRQVWRRPVP